jgi:acetolactate synthase I/II/III large subunit
LVRLKGSQVISQTLDAYGVDHIFFVPTILNSTLVEMETTQIRRIVTHSETAAAFMADGYARASGKPGVCMAQAVGVGNLAAGLRDAIQTASPIIAITGGPMRGRRHRFQYQEVEDRGMFTPVTKASYQADHVDRLGATLRLAFRTATTGRSGPVHIEMVGHHGDILESETTESPVMVEERFRSVPPHRPGAPMEEVRAAADLIAAASRPVIVAGGGVRQSGAAGEVTAFAESFSIPVVTSLAGKDVVPATHPLSAGVVGLYSRETANRLVEGADVVLLVGTRAGSQSTHGWRFPSMSQTVVHIDIDPEVSGRNYPGGLALVGDVLTVLGQLREDLDTRPVPDHRWWTDHTMTLVAEWYGKTTSLRESDSVPIRPERLCAELTEHLPDDGMLVADTGHAGMWAAGFVDLNSADQRFLRAAGTLGWALPAGIGAQCALPDRPVVVLTGDGGALYHISELETAARWGIPVTVIVNNNSSLNQEINIWTEAYGGELKDRHHELWQFGKVDFAALANSLGVEARRVDEPSDLRAAITSGVESDRPFLIDVVTDMYALAPEAYASEPDRGGTS